MGDREARDIEIAHGEPRTGLETLDRWRIFAPIDVFRGAMGRITREAPVLLTTDGRETRGVVAMFMGDEHGVEVFNTLIDRGQAFLDFSPAEPGIDEKPGTLGRDKRGISAAATRENADLDDRDLPYWFGYSTGRNKRARNVLFLFSSGWG